MIAGSAWLVLCYGMTVSLLVVGWPKLPLGLDVFVAVWCIYYGTLGGWAIGRVPSKISERQEPGWSSMLVVLLVMIAIAIAAVCFYVAYMAHVLAPPTGFWDQDVPGEPSPIDSVVIPLAIACLGVMGGVITGAAVRQIKR